MTREGVTVWILCFCCTLGGIAIGLHVGGCS